MDVLFTESYWLIGIFIACVVMTVFVIRTYNLFRKIGATLVRRSIQARKEKASLDKALDFLQRKEAMKKEIEKIREGG